MVKKKQLLIISGIIVCVVIVFVIARMSVAPVGRGGTGNNRQSTPSFSNFFGASSLFSEDMDIKKVIADDPEIEKVIVILRERYSGRLSDKRVQIRIIGGLIRHLKKKNPYDWKDRVKAIIAAEFPEYAAELNDKIDKLDEFNAYLKENRGELQAMGRSDMKEAIQAKRREIFGPEYEEIWDREISAGKISDVIARLDGRRDLSPADKMRAYSAFTKSLYPESADRSAGRSADDIMVRNYELVNNFLEMDSIQSDLNAMSNEERARYLKQLRLSVGLSEEDARKMAETDALRDRMWDNAPAYEKERTAIVDAYQGDERERRIDEARRKYFGAGAGLIKLEEDTFKINRFRFPRRWGRD